MQIDLIVETRDMRFFGKRKDEVAKAISRLEELSKHVYVSPWHLVGVYTGSGDVEAWRNALRKAYNERVNGLIMLKVFPLFDTWRADPVYQEIVAKMSLP